MGKGTNTTTQTTSPAGPAMAAYTDLMSRASGVASQPYTPYTGDLVAPINSQQQTGIGNINQYSGWAMPYLQQAAGYATDLGQGPTPDQLSQYTNPFTQQVVDATQAQFDRSNAQAQNNLRGRAAAQGALGGDAVGVAAADLGYQQQQGQAPVIAGLYSQNYQQALNAWQQGRGQAAGMLGNLGVAGQASALAGAQAQVGAGSLEQQTQQQYLSALYNQFQIGQAFPYQQTQWLAGIDTGVGSQMGGTSSTTGPKPNPLASLLGLGVAGAGLAGNLGWKPFAARGGRIAGFAGGGDVGAAPYAGVGWIPQHGLTMGRGAPGAPPSPSAASPGMDLARAGLNMRGGDRSPGVAGRPINLNLYGTSGAVVGDILPPAPQSGLGPIHRSGGRVRGFADGGSPFEDVPLAFADRFGPATPSGATDAVAGFVPLARPDVPVSWADRWAPAADAVGGEFDPQGRNNTSAYAAPIATSAGVLPLPRPRPDDVPAGSDASADPSPEASWIPAPREGDPILRSATVTPGLERNVPDEAAPSAPVAGVGTADSPWGNALIAAGLGMMASRSPFLAGAVGEGGLAGLSTYMQQKQQAVDTAQKAKRMEIDARRLDQAAEQSRKMLELRTSQANETAAYHRDLAGRENNQFIGLSDEGFPVYVDKRTGKETTGTTKVRGKESSGYVRNADGSMSPIKGGPADPEQLSAIAKAKSTGAALPDDTADFLAERVLAGDAKALTNMGRGAQGAENIIRVQTLAARKAAERGMNPSDILAKVAEQSGLTAQQRTFGTQVARMAVNSTEAEGAIQQGLELSKKVPRGKFVPLNKLLQMADSNISDPDLLEFKTGNLAIINTYARAISPTGVPTVHDKEEAQKVISEATSPEAYERVARRMLKEIEIAHKAPLKARQEMEAIRKAGTQPGGAVPPPAGATPAPDLPETVRQNGHTYQKQPDGSMKAID